MRGEISAALTEAFTDLDSTLRQERERVDGVVLLTTILRPDERGMQMEEVIGDPSL